MFAHLADAPHIRVAPCQTISRSSVAPPERDKGDSERMWIAALSGAPRPYFGQDAQI
jgi:hypothetical protein